MVILRLKPLAEPFARVKAHARVRSAKPAALLLDGIEGGASGAPPLHLQAGP